MSAAYYVQYVLNGGKPVATSIPATEHSVMTAHKSERVRKIKGNICYIFISFYFESLD
jgi:hypothetical protein